MIDLGVHSGVYAGCPTLAFTNETFEQLQTLGCPILRAFAKGGMYKVQRSTFSERNSELSSETSLPT